MAKKIKTLLLVDDDPDDRYLFEQALAEAGPSISYAFAKDGIDAIEQLRSGSLQVPDLIFMDVNMPRMNGLDCLIELQKSELFRTIPVIMYSTSCSLTYQKICFLKGAVHYVQKASDYNELRMNLKFILSKGLPLVKTATPDL